MSPHPDSTPNAAPTGDKILAAALELFREEGFDKATMRDIANAMRVECLFATNCS